MDWAGLYEGTLPCADCEEGIKTTIEINKTIPLLSRKIILVRNFEKGPLGWDDAEV